VRGELHEIQFWEEASEPFNLTEPTKELLEWLTNRFRDRGRIPDGVLNTVEDVSVRTYRDGKAAYVLFELLDSLAASINDHPVLLQIEYRWGYARIGMEEKYTLMMLASEFWTTTQNGWLTYQKLARERLPNGMVIHETTDDGINYQQGIGTYDEVVLPYKIVDGADRGTNITSRQDQHRLLKYWSSTRTPMSVGFSLCINHHTIEYWPRIDLQPLPEDEDPDTYLRGLVVLGIQSIAEFAPEVAECVTKIQGELDVRIKYIGNEPRIWFIQAARIGEGWKPLADASVVKDKWFCDEANASVTPLSFSAEDYKSAMTTQKFREAKLHLLKQIIN
jgi:hypothetical protein